MKLLFKDAAQLDFLLKCNYFRDAFFFFFLLIWASKKTATVNGKKNAAFYCFSLFLLW